MVGKEIIFSGIIRELNILWTVSQSLFHLNFREVMGWSSGLSFFLFVMFVCWWVVLCLFMFFGQHKDHSSHKQPAGLICYSLLKAKALRP